jgi:hypothetical protein
MCADDQTINTIVPAVACASSASTFCVPSRAYQNALLHLLITQESEAAQRRGVSAAV